MSITGNASNSAGGHLRVRRMGQSALLVEVGEQRLAHLLRADLLAAGGGGVTEVVVGAGSVLVEVGPGPGADRDLVALARWFRAGGSRTRPGAGAGDPPGAGPGGGVEAGAGLGAVEPMLEIPVIYDGPDLAQVADLVGLSVAEVVVRHLDPVYTVAFLGFAPGFAYLSGLDPALALPRLDRPRTRVPAGSVAVAGERTAVYPGPTPGGWRLLGRTDLVVFDPRRDPPTPLAPGGRVRFVPHRASAKSGSSPPTSPAHQRRPPAPGSPGAARAGGPGPSPAGTAHAALRPAGPVLAVGRPGLLTTVQDLGRVGLAHLGVPRAGAVDRPSLALANALVANRPEAAGLEVTVLGPELAVEGGAVVVALTGAPAAATLDGEAVPMGRAIRMEPGQVLAVDAVRDGLRTYLGVAGGIDVEPVLGSRSTDTLAGLGPPPLRAGDRLAVGPAPAGPDPAGPGPAGPGPAGPGPAGGPAWRAPPRGQPVRVLPGPHLGWFTDEAVEAFLRAGWTVTPATDRTGARLSGPALARRGRPEPDSLPMVAGAVQVPPDGQPIVALANHPTTGGYPVLAVVVAEHLAWVAQGRPGERLHFAADSGWCEQVAGSC